MHTKLHEFMPREIRVRLTKAIDRSYRMVVEVGVLKRLSSLIVQTWSGKSIFIITDSNVERLWGRQLQKQLFDARIESLVLSFPAGEASKNARTVHALHTQLLSNGIRRDSLIVALGGGVVGDVAGFVAATVLRGVKYIQVPTTLLSQVDSSVGGKVGIDHSLGKNLIGAFHQPAAVFIDPNVLTTLPQHEFRNGLAEVVKIAAALDRKFFEFLERNTSRITKTNQKLLTEIISRSVALKAAIVERDEFETGVRKALNLGHTIGHAIEAASNFSIRHGAAVSIGIVAESKIAVQCGLLKKRDFERVVRLLRSLKLPTGIPAIKNKSRFFSALSSDKKSVGNKTKFVLMKGIGRSVIGVEVPLESVQQLLTRKQTHRKE